MLDAIEVGSVAALFTKILVDLLKAAGVPSRVLPVWAVVFGVACAGAVLLGRGATFTAAYGGAAFLGGILAAGVAAGVHEIGEFAEGRQGKRTLVINATTGTHVAPDGHGGVTVEETE